ncbi:LysR family transcriptional regulator [Sphingomonas floccifaciens]|uniref:LysR family transcriptional regulator n=1 Tax=Sphingomonas floccifaciens TaxID=1844115 RepID=A0ABW4NBY7_9SPHN
MIELKAMRLFVALADELHFGRTANRLGIAQSALSTQVLRIEDRLGALLFDRGRRSAVSLTQVGRIFLVEARAAIAQVERAERIGRMAGRGEAGPARIGYVLSAALSGALPNALSASCSRGSRWTSTTPSWRTACSRTSPASARRPWRGSCARRPRVACARS